MSKPGYESRSGPNHPRWSDDRMIAETGYVKIRVGKEHPLADPNGYAYEHLVVWVSAGNPRPKPGWLLHHKDEAKTNNQIGNLELKTKVLHGVEHLPHALTDQQIRDIRQAYASGEADTRMLGKQYGYPASTVWKWVRGLSRASAGGPVQTVGRYANRAGL